MVNFNNNVINAIPVADPSGPTAPNLTVHIRNNTIIAQGQNDVVDQWGIQLWSIEFEDAQFSLTGTVTGNRILDMATIDPYPLPGIGIYAETIYDMDISGNTIGNVNIGMHAGPIYNTRISHNRISGRQGDAAGAKGVALSGSDSWVNQNRLEHLETGVLLFIEVEFYGSALNTSLDNNRFENVNMDVTTTSDFPFGLTTNVLRNQSKLRR
jgi:hypothetical protein